jgi:hypothetical protein
MTLNAAVRWSAMTPWSAMMPVPTRGDCCCFSTSSAQPSLSPFPSSESPRNTTHKADETKAHETPGKAVRPFQCRTLSPDSVQSKSGFPADVPIPWINALYAAGFQPGLQQAGQLSCCHRKHAFRRRRPRIRPMQSTLLFAFTAAPARAGRTVSRRAQKRANTQCALFDMNVTFFRNRYGSPPRLWTAARHGRPSPQPTGTEEKPRQMRGRSLGRKLRQGVTGP